MSTDQARQSFYNSKIQALEATQIPPTELEALWIDLMSTAVRPAIALKYKEIPFSEDQLDQMAVIELELFYKNLEPAKKQSQLLALRDSLVGSAIAQLQHERDNADKEGQAADASDKCYQDGYAGKPWQLLLDWMICRIGSNFAGAPNENDPVSVAIYAITGISIKDIGTGGILGGDNSFLRKIVPTWSDGSGFLGGENSFFRKNLGLPW